MGLIVARRLFPEFRVSFYDKDGREVPYEPDTVVGTKIEMRIGLSDA